MGILTDLSLRLRTQTAELKSGLAEANTKVKSFGKNVQNTGKTANRSFSNMQKGAGKSMGLVSNALSSIGPAGSVAASGLRSMSVAAVGLNAALGPIGIILGAIAIVVKALASYFKGSVDGAERFASIMGVIKGVIAGLQDIFIQLGRAMVAAFDDPKQAVADLWEAIKTNIINRMQGLVEFFATSFSAISNGFKGLGKSIKGVFNDDAKKEAAAYFDQMQKDLVDTGKAAFKMTTGLDAETVIKKTGAALEEIARKAKIIQGIEQERFALRMRILETARSESNMRAKMATLLLKTRDYESAANDERQKALIELEKMEMAIAERRIVDAQKAVELKRKENAATESSVEDLEELQKLEAEYNNVLINRDNKLREIKNRQVEFQNSVQKFIEAGIVGWEKMSRFEAEAALKAHTEKLALEKAAQDEIRKTREAAEGSWSNYQKAKAEETYVGRLQNLKDTLKEGLILEQEYAARVADLRQEQQDELTENAKKAAEEVASIYESSSDGIKGLVGGWKQLFIDIGDGAKLTKDNLTELIAGTAQGLLEITETIGSALGNMFEASKNRELKAAGKSAKKREEIEKRFAQKQKKISIAQALINGALGITKGFAQLGPIAGLIAAGLTAATTAAQIAVISSQSFAKGGLVYGPTLGLVGEYPGARSNPEVIAPLSKLEDIIGQTGGTQVFRIQGEDLVAVTENYYAKLETY